MPKREHSPLTDEQKDLLRSKFIKLCPLKNACTYCSKIVSSDHIARWASHFRACKKVNDADKRAYYALGNDPMPASKRKAFQAPIPQEYGDMMGIELVLHASLLSTMQDDPRKPPRKKRNVPSKTDAHEIAENLVSINFNLPKNEEDTAVDAVDTEFAEALAKAQSYFIAAEKEKAANIAATQGEDSLSTEKDDNIKLEKNSVMQLEDSQNRDSPSFETRTDNEDFFLSERSSDFSMKSADANPVIETLSLKKAPMVPAFECP